MNTKKIILGAPVILAVCVADVLASARPTQIYSNRESENGKIRLNIGNNRTVLSQSSNKRGSVLNEAPKKEVVIKNDMRSITELKKDKRLNTDMKKNADSLARYGRRDQKILGNKQEIGRSASADKGNKSNKYNNVGVYFSTSKKATNVPQVSETKPKTQIFLDPKDYLKAENIVLKKSAYSTSNSKMPLSRSKNGSINDKNQKINNNIKVNLKNKLNLEGERKDAEVGNDVSQMQGSKELKTTKIHKIMRPKMCTDTISKNVKTNIKNDNFEMPNLEKVDDGYNSNMKDQKNEPKKSNIENFNIFEAKNTDIKDNNGDKDKNINKNINISNNNQIEGQIILTKEKSKDTMVNADTTSMNDNNLEMQNKEMQNNLIMGYSRNDPQKGKEDNINIINNNPKKETLGNKTEIKDIKSNVQNLLIGDKKKRVKAVEQSENNEIVIEKSGDKNDKLNDFEGAEGGTLNNRGKGYLVDPVQDKMNKSAEINRKLSELGENDTIFKENLSQNEPESKIIIRNYYDDNKLEGGSNQPFSNNSKMESNTKIMDRTNQNPEQKELTISQLIPNEQNEINPNNLEENNIISINNNNLGKMGSGDSNYGVQFNQQQNLEDQNKLDNSKEISIGFIEGEDKNHETQENQQYLQENKFTDTANINMYQITEQNKALILSNLNKLNQVVSNEMKPGKLVVHNSSISHGRVGNIDNFKNPAKLAFNNNWGSNIFKQRVPEKIVINRRVMANNQSENYIDNNETNLLDNSNLNYIQSNEDQKERNNLLGKEKEINMENENNAESNNTYNINNYNDINNNFNEPGNLTEKYIIDNNENLSKTDELQAVIKNKNENNEAYSLNNLNDQKNTKKNTKKKHNINNKRYYTIGEIKNNNIENNNYKNYEMNDMDSAEKNYWDNKEKELLPKENGEINIPNRRCIYKSNMNSGFENYEGNQYGEDRFGYFENDENANNFYRNNIEQGNLSDYLQSYEQFPGRRIPNMMHHIDDWTTPGEYNNKVNVLSNSIYSLIKQSNEKVKVVKRLITERLFKLCPKRVSSFAPDFGVIIDGFNKAVRVWNNLQKHKSEGDLGGIEDQYVKIYKKFEVLKQKIDDFYNRLVGLLKLREGDQKYSKTTTKRNSINHNKLRSRDSLRNWNTIGNRRISNAKNVVRDKCHDMKAHLNAVGKLMQSLPADADEDTFSLKKRYEEVKHQFSELLKEYVDWARQIDSDNSNNKEKKRSNISVWLLTFEREFEPIQVNLNILTNDLQRFLYELRDQGKCSNVDENINKIKLEENAEVLAEIINGGDKYLKEINKRLDGVSICNRGKIYSKLLKAYNDVHTAWTQWKTQDLIEKMQANLANTSNEKTSNEKKYITEQDFTFLSRGRELLGIMNELYEQLQEYLSASTIGFYVQEYADEQNTDEQNIDFENNNKDDNEAMLDNLKEATLDNLKELNRRLNDYNNRQTGQLGLASSIVVHGMSKNSDNFKNPAKIEKDANQNNPEQNKALILDNLNKLNQGVSNEVKPGKLVVYNSSISHGRVGNIDNFKNPAKLAFNNNWGSNIFKQRVIDKIEEKKDENNNNNKKIIEKDKNQNNPEQNKALILDNLNKLNQGVSNEVKPGKLVVYNSSISHGGVGNIDNSVDKLAFDNNWGSNIFKQRVIDKIEEKKDEDKKIIEKDENQNNPEQNKVLILSNLNKLNQVVSNEMKPGKLVVHNSSISHGRVGNIDNFKNPAKLAFNNNWGSNIFKQRVIDKIEEKKDENNNNNKKIIEKDKNQNNPEQNKALILDNLNKLNQGVSNEVKPGKLVVYNSSISHGGVGNIDNSVDKLAFDNNWGSNIFKQRVIDKIEEKKDEDKKIIEKDENQNNPEQNKALILSNLNKLNQVVSNEMKPGKLVVHNSSISHGRVGNIDNFKNPAKLAFNNNWGSNIFKQRVIDKIEEKNKENKNPTQIISREERKAMLKELEQYSRKSNILDDSQLGMSQFDFLSKDNRSNMHNSSRHPINPTKRTKSLLKSGSSHNNGNYNLDMMQQYQNYSDNELSQSGQPPLVNNQFNPELKTNKFTIKSPKLPNQATKSLNSTKNIIFDSDNQDMFGNSQMSIFDNNGHNTMPVNLNQNKDRYHYQGNDALIGKTQIFNSEKTNYQKNGKAKRRAK